MTKAEMKQYRALGFLTPKMLMSSGLVESGFAAARVCFWPFSVDLTDIDFLAPRICLPFLFQPCLLHSDAFLSRFRVDPDLSPFVSQVLERHLKCHTAIILFNILLFESILALLCCTRFVSTIQYMTSFLMRCDPSEIVWLFTI